MLYLECTRVLMLLLSYSPWRQLKWNKINIHNHLVNSQSSYKQTRRSLYSFNSQCNCVHISHVFECACSFVRLTCSRDHINLIWLLILLKWAPWKTEKRTNRLSKPFEYFINELILKSMKIFKNTSRLPKNDLF